MKPEEQLFEKLMTIPRVDGLGVREGIRRVGALVDLSDMLGRPEGAIRALEWADTLEKSDMPEPEAVLLEYFRANAWAARRGVARTAQGFECGEKG